MVAAMSAVTAAGNTGNVTAANVSGSVLPDMTRTQSGASPFGDLLADAVGQATRLEDQARLAVDGLMTGSGVDVHQAMIAEQKAEMAFELALSARNKAVEAYQQMMGMQF